MKGRSMLFTVFTITVWAYSTIGCSSEKMASNFGGTYKGTAVATVATVTTKNVTIAVTSSDNPVAGTYTVGSSGSEEKGKVSGSILGAILDMTLKPDGSGTTYSFSGAVGDDNTTISGTMKGIESGKSVTYTVNLTR